MLMPETGVLTATTVTHVDLQHTLELTIAFDFGTLSTTQTRRSLWKGSAAVLQQRQQERALSGSTVSKARQFTVSGVRVPESVSWKKNEGAARKHFTAATSKT